MLKHWGALILAATLVAAAPIPSPRPSQPPPPSLRKVTSDQQQKANGGPKSGNADQRGTHDMPLVVKVLSTPQRDKEAADEAGYAKEDATNNGHLLVVTCALAILAFLQWIAMTWQAILTRRALDESNRQHRISNRAFVFFTRMESHKIFNNANEIVGYVGVPMWKNSGNTPSKGARVSANWTRVPGDLPNDFGYDLPAFGPISVGPQMEVGNPNSLDLPADLARSSRQDQIYIWGRVEYADILGGKNRFTRFCVRYDVKVAEIGGAFTTILFYGPHNGTEEDE